MSTSPTFIDPFTDPIEDPTLPSNPHSPRPPASNRRRSSTISVTSQNERRYSIASSVHSNGIGGGGGRSSISSNGTTGGRNRARAYSILDINNDNNNSANINNNNTNSNSNSNLTRRNSSNIFTTSLARFKSVSSQGSTSTRTPTTQDPFSNRLPSSISLVDPETPFSSSSYTEALHYSSSSASSTSSLEDLSFSTPSFPPSQHQSTEAGGGANEDLTTQKARAGTIRTRAYVEFFQPLVMAELIWMGISAFCVVGLTVGAVLVVILG